jgi:phenylacetate-CoA ligase
LQERKLRAVLTHAYENVAYYRSLFRSAGISPDDIQSIEDLKHVPITTKDDLRAAGQNHLIARGIDLSSCHVTRTSGTTGKPFMLYHTPSESLVRHLLGFRAHLAIGLRWRDRLCVLGDDAPHPTPLHHRLGVYRVDYVPVRLPLEEQIRQLRRARPTILRAWPNRLRSVLHQLDGRLSEVIWPRMLITSAEVCDEPLRKKVQADLGVEMFNFYSASESGLMASECTTHEGLHLHADHCILECLQEDGRPADPDTPGVAVLTSLHGFTMPFIRYRLGDICTRISKPCSCGSAFPLIGPPLGRQEDLVRLKSGRLLSAMGLGLIIQEFDGIDHYRFIQEGLDHLVLQLVFPKAPGEELLSELQTRILAYLREPVKLEIQLVDFIPEERRKFRKFISKLPQGDSDR